MFGPGLVGPMVEPEAECACADSGAGGALGVAGEPRRMAEEFVRECGPVLLLAEAMVRSGGETEAPIMGVGEREMERWVCLEWRLRRES